MKILLAAATPFEIAPTLEFLVQKSEQSKEGGYQIDKLNIIPFVHGVGSVLTSAHLSRALANKFQMVIQAGVAGSYDKNIKLGEVVQVVQDSFIDLGVEEKNGDFTSVFEMNLIEENVFPFQEGWIKTEHGELPTFLPKVIGGTVNKVHGTQESIDKTLEKYPELEVESMEGAAAAYVAKLFSVPFIQVRAISNYVEPRNRDAWEIELAIKNLNETLINMIETLSEIKKEPKRNSFSR